MLAIGEWRLILNQRRTGRRRKMPVPLASDPLADDRGLSKRKLRQLCRQVERAVSTALADDCHDSVLLELLVHTVLPWPNASRLLVAVSPSDPDGKIDRDLVLLRLEAAKPTLRAVVATAIHRKRTPNLCFEIFSPEATEELTSLVQD